MLIVLIILVNLGMWQLRRLDERHNLNREITAGLNQPPITITDSAINPADLHRQRVSASGTFDNQNSIILRGRTLNGQQGAELVVPLQLAESNQAVLVNRGWIPLADSQREARRIFDALGRVTIAGLAYQTQTRPKAYFAPTDPPLAPNQSRLDVWFRVDIDRIQEQVEYPLLSVFIDQTLTEESSLTLPIAHKPFELNDGSHLGYAIQWFLFTIILALIYGAFSWQEWRKERGT